MAEQQNSSERTSQSSPLDHPGNQQTTNSNETPEKIRVAVRLRPFTQRERQANARRIVDIEQNTVVLHHPNSMNRVKKFTFDYSYWSHDGFKRDANGLNVPDLSHVNSHKYVDQDKVFQDLGRFLLENCVKGYNSALLAYGQTGSGKSYTVSGYGQNEGILSRFARELFNELEKQRAADQSVSKQTDKDSASKSPTKPKSQAGESSKQQQQQQYKYEIYFSMLEIYNEVVRDLLAKSHGHTVPATIPRRGLKVREHPKHGFFVEGLTAIRCNNRHDIETRIEEGQLNKSIASTSMNETSSRGHTIYKFTVKQLNWDKISGQDIITTSIVQLVDLAGNERTSLPPLMNRSISPANARSNSPAGFAPQFSGAGHSKHPVGSSPVGATSIGAGGAAKQQQQQQHSSVTKQHQQLSQRFRESVSINQSLSALGNCIQILSQNSQLASQQSLSQNMHSMSSSTSSSSSAMSHPQQYQTSTGSGQQSDQQTSQVTVSTKRQKVPYRDSVLTKLLNNCCLSGNSKTVIIATLSPADINYDDTLSTLRFADRAKQIKTHAHINEIQDEAQVLHSLRKENQRLKEMVDRRSHRSDDSSQTSNFDETESVMENFTGSRIGKVHNGQTPTTTAATAISKHQRLAPTHAQPLANANPAGAGKRANDATGSTPKKSQPGAAGRSAANMMKAASQQVSSPQKTRARQQQLKKADSAVVGASKKSQNEQPKSENNQKDANENSAETRSTLQEKSIGSPSNLTSTHHRRLSRESEIECETPEPSDGVNYKTSSPRDATNRDAKVKKTLLPVATSDTDETGEASAVNDAEVQRIRDQIEGAEDEEEEEEGYENDGDDDEDNDDEETDMEMDLEVSNDELFRDDVTSPSENSIANGVAEDEDLSEMERIDLVNKTISNTGQTVSGHSGDSKDKTANTNKVNRRQQQASKQQRLATKGDNFDGAPNDSNQLMAVQNRHSQPSMRRVSLIASELKQHHPHLSNLNADEQLSGKLSYIIKPGSTSLGKNDSCDIVLRGLDIRANHATVIYDQTVTAISANQQGPPLKRIYIEPALDSIEEQQEQQQPDSDRAQQPEVPASSIYSVAPIFVNGAPIKTRTELHHCDRILFGTNVYFVFVDNGQQEQKQQQQNGSQDGDTQTAEERLWPDSITYDMARAEVLKNKMLNDEMINGNILRDLLMQSSGAKRDKLLANGRLSSAKATSNHGNNNGNNGKGNFHQKKSRRPKSAAATVSEYDQQNNQEQNEDTETVTNDKEYYGAIGESDAEAPNYHDYMDEDDRDAADYEEFSEQIRLDTAELAWQVEEVNKIAKEMDIKLTYELCVLTGAEQLIAPIEMGENWFDHQSNYTVAMMQSAMSKLSHSSSRSSSKSSSIVGNEATQIGDQNMSQVTSRASSSFRSNTTLDSNHNNTCNDGNYYAIRQSPNGANNINGDDDDQDVDNQEERQHQQSSGSVASKQTITDLNRVDASRMPAAVFVKVKTISSELAMEFYWSKDKFIDRRFKIQDLYGVYSFDNGGRQAIIAYLIEQSNHQPIIDPFFDDPRCTFVLIGHVQLILQPLSHLVDIDQEYDIIDVDDHVAGTISISAIPCYESDDKYYPFTTKELEDNILDDPNELIGRKLAFMLKILSCHQIDEKYTSVYCQYMLHLDSNVARTDFVSVREPTTNDLIFNHVHYITFEEISQETLNILRYGTMTIQVVGRYVYDEVNSKPISTVFSIVNSINKHRAKLSQQHHHNHQHQHKQQQQHQHQAMINHSGTLTGVASKSGASSTASTNMDDVDEAVNVQPHEIIIDAILTKRKLDRAENQLHYLRRTVNIAEHYNKKQIPVKTVRKLLSSYSNDLDNSFEDVAEANDSKKSQHVSKTCIIS